jgi:hypothetical protein
MEKIQTMWATSVILRKTDRSKRSPTERKLVQSGHTALHLSIPISHCMQNYSVTFSMFLCLASPLTDVIIHSQ